MPESLDPDKIESKLAGLDPNARSRFWTLYSASENRLKATELAERRALLRALKDATADLEGSVAAEFARAGEGGWNIARLRRLGRYDAFLRQIEDRIRALGGTIESSVERAMLRNFKQAYAETGFRLAQMTPESVGLSFDMLPDHAILALSHEPFSGADFSERIGLITDEMAHRIKKELTTSMIQGDSWSAVARRIRDFMGTRGRGAMWRADMIARTEITRAQELGAAQLYKENEDVIEKVVWLAHPGACPICAGLNGTEVDPDDEDTLPPEASHPNCRCTTQAVPTEFDVAGVRPRQSFNDFAAEALPQVLDIPV